jgi:hypothetical protein
MRQVVVQNAVLHASSLAGHMDVAVAEISVVVGPGSGKLVLSTPQHARVVGEKQRFLSSRVRIVRCTVVIAISPRHVIPMPVADDHAGSCYVPDYRKPEWLL